MKVFVVLLGSLVVFSNGFSLENLILELVPDQDFIDERNCDVPSVYDLNVEEPNAPSPITVNECAEGGISRDATNCPELECSSNCLIPDLDRNGCLMSCDCMKSGLWGDIMMTEEDVAMMEADDEDRAGAIIDSFGAKVQRWDVLTATVKNPTRKVYVIYYRIAPNLEKNKRAIAAIDAARKDYYEKTCIYLAKKPDSFKGDYIEFFDGNRRCFSQLGRKGLGKQQISIGRGCERKGIVIHEMMHTMGFWHEQMRPDRDEHITIQWGNIKSGRESQFQKMLPKNVMSFGSRYDIGSVMQYDGRSFSKNGHPTIIDRKSKKTVIAQRNGFSDEDVAQIRAMYQCDKLQASLDL